MVLAALPAENGGFMEKNLMLKAALEYASAGLAVIPLNGKNSFVQSRLQGCHHQP